MKAFIQIAFNLINKKYDGLNIWYKVFTLISDNGNRLSLGKIEEAQSLLIEGLGFFPLHKNCFGDYPDWVITIHCTELIRNLLLLVLKILESKSTS